jgi:hypothetical protein
MVPYQAGASLTLAPVNTPRQREFLHTSQLQSVFDPAPGGGDGDIHSTLPPDGRIPPR